MGVHTRKPPDNEMLRILDAVRAGTLRVNDAGRYVIDGQRRPERRARQLCVSRGYMRPTSVYASGFVLTARGQEILEAQDAHYA